MITGHGCSLNGWNLVIPMTVVGVGMMFQIMPLMDLSLETVPVENAGAASGTLTTFAQTGMVLGVGIAGSVHFGILGDHGATEPPTQMHAVTAGLWVPVLAYAVAGVIALAMPKPHRAGTVPPSIPPARDELAETPLS